MSACLEDQILGACLLQNTIPHNLTSTDFNRHHHKTIFEYLKKLESTGKEISILTLNDVLSKDGMESIGGGIGYWCALPDCVPSGIDVNDFLIHAVIQLQRTNDVGQISNLNRKPTEIEIELILSKIYNENTTVDDEGKVKYTKKLKDDWYMILCEADQDIKNCIKYDYTVGNPVINYSNTTLLQAALTDRLWHYVPMTRVTDQVLKRIINKVSLANRDFNRVNNYLEILNSKYKQKIDPDIIHRFMNCFLFPNPEDRDHYTHIFDKFFTRMHIHLRGTSMIDDRYYGLIENDIIPVLQGGQGIGKTTLTRWVALHEDLYTDLGSAQKGTFGDINTVRMVRGKLLAEIGEMGIFRKSEDVETAKSFFSRDRYEIDQKYVEYSNAIPATVSYIATSNPEQFLADSTGNRRFYPINITGIDLDTIKNGKELIEQLHCYYYRKAREIEKSDRYEACRIDQKTIDFIEGKRNVAMIRYSDHSAIVQVVGDDYEASQMKGEKAHKISPHDIEKLLINAGYRMRVTKNGISQAMEDMGYEKKQVKIHGVNIRGYYKAIEKGSLIEMIEPPKKIQQYTVPANTTEEDIF